MSPEVIAGIVSAAAAVLALGWGVFVWRRDQATKKREADAAEFRRRAELAQGETRERTRLSISLTGFVRKGWETKRNRRGHDVTRSPGPKLSLTLGNPTDRPIRPRSMKVVGADTGQEMPEQYYVPDVIEPRDGWDDEFNALWLQENLPSDSAVIVVVETWDGETFRSPPADFP